MTLPAENTISPFEIADAREAAHKASELQRGVEDQIRNASRELAEAERQYRLALAKEILRLKAQEEVAWTAREQIARTLLHTGWFTADDLEPLGIPEQYRRSVHGSATGYFSGERLLMEEAGRRKSERPSRKGGKNTVFRITLKGRRELPGLLKGMAGPVAEANKRLFGASIAGVRSNNREGTTGSHIASTLDRPGPDSVRAHTPAADPGETSPAATTGAAGEDRPVSEPLTLLPEPDPEAWAA